MQRVVSIIRMMVSKPPDLSTAEGRSRDRYRRAALAAVTSGLARVINLGTMLATVPLLLGYLGSDRYGIYATVASFAAFLSFTDLGIGIGLQNRLSECHGRGDLDGPGPLISSAMALMVLVAAVLTVMAVVVLPHLPVDSLIKTQTAAGRDEILPTLQAVIVAFAIGLPAGLVQRTYLAYQEGFWGNMWLMLGRVLGFVGMLMCVWLSQPLWVLAGVTVGAPFLATIVGTVIISARRPYLRPAPGLVSFGMVTRLFHTSLAALICQIAGVVMMNAPGLIIANRLGTDEATTFSVTQRLLASTGMIFLTVIAPLWPAYGEARARGDYQWIAKTFRRTVKIGAAIQVPVFLALALFGRQIIYYWSGKEVNVSWALLMAINAYYLVAVWNGCCNIALSGMDRMWGQAIYVSLSSLLGVIMGYWLCAAFGSQGVMWSMTFCGGCAYALFAGMEMHWVRKHRFSRTVETVQSGVEPSYPVGTPE